MARYSRTLSPGLFQSHPCVSHNKFPPTGDGKNTKATTRLLAWPFAFFTTSTVRLEPPFLSPSHLTRSNTSLPRLWWFVYHLILIRWVAIFAPVLSFTRFDTAALPSAFEELKLQVALHSTQFTRLVEPTRLSFNPIPSGRSSSYSLPNCLL